MSSEIKLLASDVYVSREQPIMCTECEQLPGTYQVWIDFRNAGLEMTTQHYMCKNCALKLKRRIAASLPKT